MSSKLGCALVTGASSGIGADFANELADRGYDLILTARRRDRLEELKVELSARFSIQVEVLVADLGNPAGAQQLFDVAGQKLTFMVRMLMLNRRSVARAGIAGVLRGRTLVVPGILYKSLNLLLRLAPRTFTTTLADFVVKH